jgi:predicted nucleic acid-binding protein
VRIFLDASVLLAAAGSASGASRGVFDYAAAQGWTLVSSPWVLNEVLANLPDLPMQATRGWLLLRRHLVVADDVVVIDRPVIFAASKDRPILFTALASAEVLLTLDRADFATLLGGRFYGLRVWLPSDFLIEERAAGRLPPG